MTCSSAPGSSNRCVAPGTTSSRTPGATVTMRTLCGVSSVHAAGLPSAAQVAVVGDGKAAVISALTAANAGAPFDIVLMDMQMPIMDGYQATAAIRHWEREQGRTPVPIVAVTANAFPEDVERALDAGCTLHLAKPLRKSELLRVLVEHVTAPSSDQAA